MKLVSAKIGPYKSIVEPQEVHFGEDVTVLVGQNEAGKSATLEALNKAYATNKADHKFDALFDYPSRYHSDYNKKHPKGDTEVVNLVYELTEVERSMLKDQLHVSVPANFQFSTSHKYDNSTTVDLSVDEAQAVQSDLSRSDVPDEVKKALAKVKSYSDAHAKLSEQEDDASKKLAASFHERIQAASKSWHGHVTSFETYKLLRPLIPAFLYFGDYNVLPGKTNLHTLRQHRDAGSLDLKDRAVLALLNNAGVELDDLYNNKPFEETVKRLESFANNVSDRIFEFWKQNTQLEVRFEVKPDQHEQPPFNEGPNLYIRIYNQNHRVTVPFDQRSRGFIWFFSFLTWFDDAQEQAEAKTPLFLLLDEPGLNLHALAQADFLTYIEHLGGTHQVLYTTHSPFLVESSKLHRVRVVEDRDGKGTIISDHLDSRDPKSIFPLQAALGYTIAQNLFIAEKNLLVEGPTELIVLQSASAELEAQGRAYLDPETVIVPVGGVDKLATFIALLAGNKLKIAVCADKPAVPDQRLEDMVRNKIIKEKAVLDFSMFRNQNGTATDPADVEDLFGIPHYLSMFNSAFSTQLGGVPITEADLPTGTRIVERISGALASKGITLRPSGGFNHYLVFKNPVAAGITFEPLELDAFENLFKRVNQQLS